MIIRILLPLVIGHLVMQRCVAKQTDQPVIANEVRELMWPMLLIAVGFAWHLATEPIRGIGSPVDMMYVGLVAVLCWWLNSQFCSNNQSQSNLIMLLAALYTAGAVAVSARYSPLSALMLTVVLVWQLFAEQISIPKIRIRLPSIRVKLPKLTVTPGSSTSPEIPISFEKADANGNGAPAPVPSVDPSAQSPPPPAGAA